MCQIPGEVLCLHPGCHRYRGFVYIRDLSRKVCIAPFNKEETEVQRGEEIGPTSQSQYVQSQDSHPGLPSPKGHAGRDALRVDM